MIASNPPLALRASALAELQHFMAPAPPRAVERWLVELSLITSRRQDDTDTEALRLAAYSDRLAAYPADVVREVLLVMVWRWWPSWAELKPECDKLAGPRRRVQNALANWPEEEAAEREEREKERLWRMRREEGTRRSSPAEVTAFLSDREFS